MRGPVESFLKLLPHRAGARRHVQQHQRHALAVVAAQMQLTESRRINTANHGLMRVQKRLNQRRHRFRPFDVQHVPGVRDARQFRRRDNVARNASMVPSAPSRVR